MTASWAMEGDTPYASAPGLSFVVAQLSIVLHCMLQQLIWGTVMAHCVHVLAIASSLDTCFHY
jgi:hypothetical protein